MTKPATRAEKAVVRVVGAAIKDEFSAMQRRINDRYGHHCALRLDEMIRRELVASLAAARKRRGRRG